MNYVHPPTLAEAFLDAWELVMDDPVIPEKYKVRFACAFVGVPDMAMHERRNLKVSWPHPVPNETYKNRPPRP